MKKVNISVKAVAILLTIGLLIGGTVGGTLAWLLTNTNPVTNTFSTSDINITLTETTTTYKMVPGTTIPKDPKVTVAANSEACWLFVKVEETESQTNMVTTGTADATTYIHYAMGAGWTALEDVTNVYYRKVSQADATAGASYEVLSGNSVSVPASVTKDMLNKVKDNTVATPKLTFTAYAIQYEGFNDTHKTEQENAKAAWAEIK